MCNKLTEFKFFELFKIIFSSWYFRDCFVVLEIFQLFFYFVLYCVVVFYHRHLSAHQVSPSGINKWLNQKLLFTPLWVCRRGYTCAASVNSLCIQSYTLCRRRPLKATLGPSRLRWHRRASFKMQALRCWWQPAIDRISGGREGDSTESSSRAFLFWSWRLFNDHLGAAISLAAARFKCFSPLISVKQLLSNRRKQTRLMVSLLLPSIKWIPGQCEVQRNIFSLLPVSQNTLTLIFRVSF